MDKHKNKNFDIQKINNYTYKLKINEFDEETKYILYESFINFVKHSFYDNDKTSLFFTCEKIQSFEIYLSENENIISYEDSIKIINSLSIQINYLLEYNYGFYGIDIDDIIVLNDKYFIIISSEKLLKLDINCNPDLLKINKLIHIPFFHNPEIKQITQLPSSIHYKCIYYSIGLLIIYCIFGEINDQHLNLQLINSTKLYYFLERCLSPNVSDRHLLFI